MAQLLTYWATEVKFTNHAPNNSMNSAIRSFIVVLVISCSSPKDNNHDVTRFLTTWANALTQKDNNVRNLYDPAFEFPTVLVDDSANLSYTINVDSIQIGTSEDGKGILAVVPFVLVDQKGQMEAGQMKLTIATTSHGLSIKDMSQELTREVIWRNRRLKYDQDLAQRMKTYDSIWSNVRAIAQNLQQHYDTVVFFTNAGKQALYYVANGDWVYPYHDAQSDSGNYKLGVVTADNKIIVPVHYTKIYNPGGTIPGVIEVERNGLRGLYSVTGEQLIPAEFEGIYPTKAANALAQLKKDGQFGWLSNKGHVSFDTGSNQDKTLFRSPVETNAILAWQFTYPGTTQVLIEINGNSEESAGVIIYPSFLRDLGLTNVAHPWVLNNTNELGMGMTETLVKFERVESLTEKLYGLVSFFMESGADARTYQFSQNDLLILDNSMTKINRLENLTKNTYDPSPCDKLSPGPGYRIVGQGLYESNDGKGNYKYYKVTADGHVELQSTDRQYAFTKFVKIDEEYFKRCQYEQIPYNEKLHKNGDPNVIVVSGVSSDELDVMRNEIFAEYGFIFKSSKWKNYFEKKPWYKPRFDNVNDQLTETDKANIEFIVNYQKKNSQVKRDSTMFWWPA